MTTLTDLERLARAATPGHDCGSESRIGPCMACELADALPTKRVLAMIAVIEAAKAMRVDPTYRSGYLQAFDEALAALEKEQK